MANPDIHAAGHASTHLATRTRMNFQCRLLLAISMASLPTQAPLGSACADDILGVDVQLLRTHGIDGSEQSLLAYLGSIPRPAEQSAQISSLVDALGSPRFREREMAMRQLQRHGIAAADRLADAAADPDFEIRRRSALLLGELEEGDYRVLGAALRAIRQQKLSTATAGILSVLPYCATQDLRRDAQSTLCAVAGVEDHDVLLLATRAANLDQRCAATLALATALGADALPHLTALATDTNDRLRLAATRGLAEHAPRQSLTHLVTLLESPHLEVRRDAILLLRLLTGQARGYLCYDEPHARREAVQEWQTWLTRFGDTAELQNASALDPMRGSRLLISLIQPSMVVELSTDGQRLWTLMSEESVCGIRGLENGNRVFARFDARDVVEVDTRGKIVWKQTVPGTPNCLDRLENGNTVVGLYDERQVYEFSRDGAKVMHVSVPGQPSDVRRIDNGRTLVALYDANLVIEIDGRGRIVKRFDEIPLPESARRLTNGDTLITSSRTSEVMQIDAQGNKIWSAGNLPLAYDAVRLPSGNTMVAYRKGLREVDPEGDAVREIPLGNARRISIY